MNKVLIITVAFGSSRLIIKQNELIKRFCKDENFEHVVIDNSKVNNALLHILQLEMNDAGKYSWIDYFCYELDFGAKYTEGCASQYGKNIDLSSPESLYDYLKSLKDASKNP